MKKSFDKEFPSLKGRKLEMTTAEYVGRLVTEIPFKLKEGCGPIIKFCKLEDIQKHCIDKQRVRDAIISLGEDREFEINLLLKELGLEE